VTEIRWRAAWALFRPRDPASVTHLLKLSADPSAEVRFWAVATAPASITEAGSIRHGRGATARSRSRSGSPGED
jgi:HEAT repeat protein